MLTLTRTNERRAKQKQIEHKSHRERRDTGGQRSFERESIARGGKRQPRVASYINMFIINVFSFPSMQGKLHSPKRGALGVTTPTGTQVSGAGEMSEGPERNASRVGRGKKKVIADSAVFGGGACATVGCCIQQGLW